MPTKPPTADDNEERSLPVRLAAEDRVHAIMTLWRQLGESRGALHGHPLMRTRLTMPQLRTLLAIARIGPARAREIAEAVGVAPPNLTGIVDRLARDGYVERAADEHDRRALRVGLTPRGQALAQEIIAAGPGRIAAALSDLTNEELDALRAGLGALVRATERRAGLAESPPT